jgi:hypothetical protein
MAAAQRHRRVDPPDFVISVADNGYLCVKVTFGGRARSFKAHCIVWALVTGAWPVVEIDRRNGVRSDNHWNNLREATHAQNAQNRARRSDNTSGMTGVSWIERDRLWKAEVSVAGQEVYRGYFKTAEDARAAYLEAKAKHHSFQPVPRDLIEERRP